MVTALATVFQLALFAAETILIGLVLRSARRGHARATGAVVGVSIRSGEQVVAAYHDLYQVERSFRMNAVLRAAGQRAPAHRSRPAGLTAREVEILALVARGRSTKQIAQCLVISPKTVSNHVEHVYAKIGVSSRAGATLYAAQQGLVGAFEPA